MSEVDWESAPKEATHYYVGSDSPFRDLSGRDWRWWHDGKWNSPLDRDFSPYAKGLDLSSSGLIERSGPYLIERPKKNEH